MAKLLFRVFAAWLITASPVVVAQALTPLEEQGKKIYRLSSSPFGNTITAYVGQASVPLPATAMPCAGCHGRDGTGRPEGGLIPGDISWSNLSKSYGGESPTGRRFPAYTEKSFYRAVVKGIDPAGNRLDPGMPRYDLSNEEVRALIAYLQRIEDELDPGISGENIVIGSLQPADQTLQGLGQAITGVINGYFADINKTGGIFGRQLQLRVADINSADDILVKGEQLLDSETVFSMLSVFTGSRDKAYAQLLAKYQIPSVGPFTRHPASSDPAQQHTFYLFGGVAMQTRTLLEFAFRQLKVERSDIAIVYPAESPFDAINEYVRKNAPRDGMKSIAFHEYSDISNNWQNTIEQLKKDEISTVVYLGQDSQLLSFVREANEINWAPYLLVPGEMAGKSVLNTPRNFNDRIYIAYPVVLSGHSPQGMSAFVEFHNRHNLPRSNLAAQIYAYTATRIMVEGLKRSGKALSREKFINAIESLSNYEVGVAPPMSFGGGRRVGANGAYILTFDTQSGSLRPVGDWVKLETF